MSATGPEVTAAAAAWPPADALEEARTPIPDLPRWRLFAKAAHNLIMSALPGIPSNSLAAQEGATTLGRVLERPAAEPTGLEGVALAAAARDAANRIAVAELLLQGTGWVVRPGGDMLMPVVAAPPTPEAGAQ